MKSRSGNGVARRNRSLRWRAFAHAVGWTPGGWVEGLEERRLLSFGPLGPALLVNQTTEGDQTEPAIAVSPQGDGVIVWQSKHLGNGGVDVYAQRVDALGTPVGPELRVNATTVADQQHADVAIDASGNFVVVWEGNWQGTTSGYPDLYGRIFDAGGAPKTGEFPINQSVDMPQQFPSVAMSADGKFVVAWESWHRTGEDPDIYARRFNRNGQSVGGEFLVNDPDEMSQTEPAVAIDESGAFVVAYREGPRDSAGPGRILARRYVEGESNPSSTVVIDNGDCVRPDVAISEQGAYALTWQTTGEDQPDRVFLRTYGPGGGVGDVVAIGAEAGQSEYAAAIATLDGGGFAVAWYDYAYASEMVSFWQQRFNAAGGAEDEPVRIVDWGQGLRGRPAIAGGGGGFMAAWEAMDEEGATTDVFTRQYGQLVAPSVVGGSVWHDANGNGVLEAGETGVGDVTVRLLTASGEFVQETTTDPAGLYYFAGVRPTLSGYRVEFVGPDEMAFTAPNQGTSDALDSDADLVTGRTPRFVLSPGQVDFSMRAGFVAGGSISGTAFKDLNANGQQEQFEPALGGRVVFLDSSGDGRLGSDEPSAVTDAEGAYRISHLRPGAYRVMALPDYPWQPVGPAGGVKEVALGVGQALQGVNFGYKAVSVLAFPPKEGWPVAANAQQSEGNVAVSANEFGDFVVVWTRQPGEEGEGGLFGRLYDSAGEARGEEFLISVGEGSLFEPDVVMDRDGDFVVAWQEMTGELTSQVLYQLFDAQGAPRGDARPVGSEAQIGQGAPALAMAAGGRFIIAWESADETVDWWEEGPRAYFDNIYAQWFSAEGSPVVSEFRVNDEEYDEKHNPDIEVTWDGRAVIVWESWYQDCTCGPGVYGKRYSADGQELPTSEGSYGTGQGEEFAVNTYTSGNQYKPAVAMNEDGSFVVVWQSDYQDVDSSPGIYGQQYGSEGNRQGEEFRVNATWLNDQTDVDVAMDGMGGYVVVWQSKEGVNGPMAVVGQQFYASGDRAGGEFRVSSAGNSARNPAIAMMGAAGYVVAWEQSEVSEGSGASLQSDVYARRYERSLETATVGGVVWQDMDANGAQDPGEPGMPGVEVRLLAEDGAKVFSALTDDHGRYQISGINPGPRFLLEFGLMEEHVFTLAHQGEDGSLDSDAQIDSGRTDLFVLGDNEVDLEWDAGLIDEGVIAGIVFSDMDEDGEHDETEPGVSNWYVFLDADGDGAWTEGERREITDPEGSYRIDRLRPGTYRVVGAVQHHWTPVQPAGGWQEVAVALGAHVGQVDFAMYTDVPVRGATPRTSGDLVVQAVTNWLQGIEAASDAAGNFMVVWSESLPQRLGDVYARRFSASGAALGDAFMVNEAIEGNQGSASVAMNASGQTLVVWANFQSGVGRIMARRFGADGLPVSGEFQVSEGPAWATVPAVAINALGEFVVAWRSGDPAGNIRARRYRADGAPIGSEFIVSEGLQGSSERLSVAMDGRGAFVVAWDDVDIETENSRDIYVRRFDPSGQPLGPESRVNQFTPGWQSDADVAMDAHGAFAVTWRSSYWNGSANLEAVFVARFSASGQREGDDLSLGLPNTAYLESPSVAMTEYGEMTVAWEAYSPSQSDDVYAQRFNAAGQPQGPAFRANATTSRGQFHPEVAMSRDGDLTVMWIGPEGRTVEARQFQVAGEPAAIGGVAWQDMDANGVREPWETLISNIEVRLLDRQGNLVTATRTENGSYRFGRLVPNMEYQVEFVRPGNLFFSPPHQGVDDQYDSDADRATGRTPMVRPAAGAVEGGLNAGLVAPAILVLSSTPGDDTYLLRAKGDTGELRIFNDEAATSLVSSMFIGELSRIRFNGMGGHDRLIIDLSEGLPLPSGGISFDGGDGEDDLILLGTGIGDQIAVSSNAVDMNGRVITHIGLEHLRVGVASGAVEIGSLSIGDTARVELAASGDSIAGMGRAFVFDQLSVAASAQLDIANNGVIVKCGDGAAKLSEMESLLKSGRRGGAWDGPGIVSSSAARDATATTTVGALNNDGGGGTPLLTSFGTRPVDAQCVLLRYTYYGDANLDGEISGSDYAVMDLAYWLGTENPGWRNGDSNLDGEVAGDDYSRIDLAYWLQEKDEGGEGITEPEASAATAAIAFSEVPIHAVSAIPAKQPDDSLVVEDLAVLD